MSDEEQGALTAAAVEYASLLGSEVKPFPPAKLGPGGFVVPGDPWLEAGETFGSLRIRLDGVLIVRMVNNETATTEIRKAVTAALVACFDAKWRVERVDAPYPLTQDGDNVQYLAALITATKPIRALTEGVSP